MEQRKPERLVNLVICLLAARRFITRAEIRQSVEGYAGLDDVNFQRMFERDKEDLRALGVPLELGPSDLLSDGADGYRIRRADFELPPLELSRSEVMLVGLATRVWQEATLDDATSRGIAKLRAVGIASSPGRLVAIAPSLSSGEPAFPVLWQAWLTRTPVRFTYHGKPRDFEPWKLILRQGRWYAAGRDRAAGVRLFKLSRIEDEPRLLEGEPPFATVSGAELAERLARLETPEPVDAALLAITPDGAPALRRRGRALTGKAAPAGVTAPDGYTVYRVPYAREDEIVAEAAAAGTDVLVLAPDEVRARVVEHLRWVAGRGGGA